MTDTSKLMATPETDDCWDNIGEHTVNDDRFLLSKKLERQRNMCLHGLIVASEAIDRLHDVATGNSGESADEIAFIINTAKDTIAEAIAARRVF